MFTLFMYLYSYPSYQCQFRLQWIISQGRNLGIVNSIYKLYSCSFQIGIKIDFFMVCRLCISISKDWKRHALGQRKCSMVRPLIPINCFINSSEPQNKHTNKQHSQSHARFLSYHALSLWVFFTVHTLLERDLHFVDDVWYKFHFASSISTA